MPAIEQSLSKLIENELLRYEELLRCVRQYPDNKARISKVSVRHHEAVTAVLDLRPSSHEDIIEKCRFMFKTLRRHYDNDPYFTTYEDILVSDIRLVAP